MYDFSVSGAMGCALTSRIRQFTVLVGYLVILLISQGFPRMDAGEA